MKKRLIATVLAFILLLLALPISASAASSSLKDIIDGSLTKWINITDHLVIDKNTEIPEGYIVNILPGITVFIDSNVTLTVKGTLNDFGTIILGKYSQIKESGNGAYTKYSQYEWTYYYQYFFLYPGYSYPPYYWYPGYEDIIDWWSWPIDVPIFPTLPDYLKDEDSIREYYNYLLWMYKQGYIDEEKWKELYPYWYFYIGTPYVAPTCATPTASVKSGTTVDFGSTVGLSSTTPGVNIYYTTDGSTPDTSSKLYTGPIKIDKTEITIKAIAVKSGYKDSAVATFTYKTKASVGFTDLGAHADALLPALITLVQAKVIPDGTTLNPEGSVSYDELMGWLAAIGLNTGKAVIDDSCITNKTALTYEDFAYVCYRVLLVNYSLVQPPKKSEKVVLSNLKYGSDVTAKPSIVRAGVMSLIEAELFYKLDFYPKSAAARAYAFYLLGEVYNRIH